MSAILLCAALASPLSSYALLFQVIILLCAGPVSPLSCDALLCLVRYPTTRCCEKFAMLVGAPVQQVRYAAMRWYSKSAMLLCVNNTSSTAQSTHAEIKHRKTPS